MHLCRVSFVDKSMYMRWQQMVKREMEFEMCSHHIFLLLLLLLIIMIIGKINTSQLGRRNYGDSKLSFEIYWKSLSHIALCVWTKTWVSANTCWLQSMKYTPGIIKYGLWFSLNDVILEQHTSMKGIQALESYTAGAKF